MMVGHPTELQLTPEPAHSEQTLEGELIYAKKRVKQAKETSSQ